MPGLLRSVTLRALQPGDLEAVHLLLSDWNVVRHMLLPHCNTLDQSRNCLNDLITQSSGAAWLSFVRAIEDQDSGELVGLCGIAVLEGSEQGEIWYLLRPDHWGRGIATEAARSLLRIGFTEMNLHRMFATCLPENPRSCHVLDKIGMRKEAYHRENLKIHGVWRDCHLYALLREEWEALAGIRKEDRSELDAALERRN